jgi:hypothetical protein
VSIDVARRIADAVMYEGYVLYPYRASAQKNQVRWQWGVLFPPSYADQSSEASRSQTQFLVEGGGDPHLTVALRFLQVQHRAVEVGDGGGFTPVDVLEIDGSPVPTWDETVEHEITAELPLSAAFDGYRLPVAVDGGHDIERVAGGRVVRTRQPLTADLRLAAAPVPGPYGAIRLTVTVENAASADAAGTRDQALRSALVATHTLTTIAGGTFVSMLDHPEWAAGAVAECDNVGSWPILVGEPGSANIMLGSPIILYDYPTIADESPGELFDGLEIDEILSLRTMTLTDEEKREVRGTDARTAALLDRVDAMPAEILERLHGAVRSVRPAAEVPDPGERVPWWDPAADASVDPDTDEVLVGAVAVRRGSSVILRPGMRRTDAQDMFLTGREARVEAVLRDLEDESYLAVTLADDPGADVAQAHGRFLYFRPDEVEPV